MPTAASDSSWPVSLFMRPHQVPGGDLRACVEVARIADRAGIHSIHFGEHQVIGPRTHLYPYGDFGHHPDVPWMEPMVTLAAMASVTTNIRLAPSVLLAPLRPAILVAKTAATLDVLSGGRLDLGLGIGWQPEEYSAAGVPWSERSARFDECVEVCRAVWDEQPVTFRGEWIDLDEVVVLPRPVQPRLPIWYGVAMTEARADHLARWGDGWCPIGLTDDQLREGIRRVHDACARVGREPDSLVIRYRPDQPIDRSGRIDLAATFENAARQRAMGVTLTTVGPPVGIDSLAGISEFIDEALSVAASFEGSTFEGSTRSP